LIGKLSGTGGGRSLILNGHVDVVPVGDLQQWTEDPFSGVVEDGKLYGRGVTDMKAGTFALIIALRAIQSQNIKLKGDILFHSVVEEESGGAGTLWLTKQGKIVQPI